MELKFIVWYDFPSPDLGSVPKVWTGYRWDENTEFAKLMSLERATTIAECSGGEVVAIVSLEHGKEVQ